ncbi:hypothetical protein O6H91_15G001000 [Diphasiastrum complanatum]|uniref:Uncharacterized protein n=3 Tax=Diphasiastrum complanatum TaxID=34168 RepID=A0ACC2BF90_DIPCM|nr:hypothetical protein O6H91_15G001000 [Diphasiastrum complanatum]KAJ7528379.1 hypothetical protein O6H91_15G001000 [Diphasiastrum complanatum]KAJ7528380.1 hypothetical protein O6H91_15G001000 [Diphasiastrum complanatum]
MTPRLQTLMSMVVLGFGCMIMCLSCCPAVVHAVQGLMKITYKYEGHFPESFDWDKSHRRFLVGSTAKGSLIAVSVVDEFVEVKDFVEDPDYAGKAAVLGVCVDSIRNRVVVAVHNINYSKPPFNAVAAYDLDSKKRILFARLDGIRAGESVINDVAVDAEGNIFATNTLGNYIWKINLQGEASVFVESPVFSFPSVVVSAKIAAVGLNGIVYHTGGYLLVGQSNTGSLFKVDLSTKEVHLTLKESLKAADGMAIRKGGSLVVVSADKMWLLTSKSDWMTATIEEELSLNASSFATAVIDKDGYHSFILHSYLTEAGEGSDRDLFEIEEKQFIKDTEDDAVWLIVIIVLFVVIITAWRFQMAHFYKQYRKKQV